MKKLLIALGIVCFLLVGCQADGGSKQAEIGDVVNIDFLGKLDGEAFEGGQAESQVFFLGYGGFIDGFESQITGMETGDKKVITVTFPKDYASKDLAGKECTFDITMNKIYKEVK